MYARTFPASSERIRAQTVGVSVRVTVGVSVLVGSGESDGEGVWVTVGNGMDPQLDRNNERRRACCLGPL